MNEADKFLKDYLATTAGNNSHVASDIPQSRPQRSQAAFKQQSYRTTSSSMMSDDEVEFSQSTGAQVMVSFGDAIKRYWSNWSLDGRSSRSEYWFSILFLMIAWFGISLVSPFIGGTGLLVPLQILWCTIVCWPSFAMGVRRYHDLGYSGGYPAAFAVAGVVFQIAAFAKAGEFLMVMLLLLVVMAIINLIFVCKPSEPRANQYGPVPNVK